MKSATIAPQESATARKTRLDVKYFLKKALRYSFKRKMVSLSTYQAFNNYSIRLQRVEFFAQYGAGIYIFQLFFSG